MWQGTDLSYLHVLIFLLVVALILAPLAGRLKILNLIDFNSKLESFKEETKKDLTDIKNIITTTIETRIAPVQQQWTVLSMSDSEAKQSIESIIKNATGWKSDKEDSIDEAESPRIKFLRKADLYRARAFTVLAIARGIHIAFSDHRMPEAEDITPGTVDESITSIIDILVVDGVDWLFPSSAVVEITEGFETIKNILELRQKVDSKEVEPPSEQESEELFSKVEDSIRGIAAGVIIRGSDAVIYQQAMSKAIEELQDSLNTQQ